MEEEKEHLQRSADEKIQLEKQLEKMKTKLENYEQERFKTFNLKEKEFEDKIALLSSQLESAS